ncbi:Uncharacterised protein [BD1-7 clade bacterium]|uniref:Protein hcp1 n=1 Tax=BD1-7 clade bacterium TaxID=2029982 RepID=A0A5S9Q9S6_9GAMM|nr:Uncharacterised protein [BD1-7 clade bacterium]CAA0114017.1 Uncharacterised protein [BD1-7 clade bacterium]CAA0115008.1 Uncharacterised protein [BD1-7 clade bacterium]
MASIYMRIEGVDIKDGATVEGLPDSGWVALNSYSWSAVRGVTMDIGNANNSDTGMVALSEVNVSKEVDSGSEGLLSFLYSPGTEGKTVWVAFTKPTRDGSGAEVYFQIKLLKARIVSYNVSGSDGAQPYENLAFSYTQIDQTHWHEDDGGNMQQGGLVSYSVPQGKMLSGAQ